jgi:hypothetical protein
VPSHFNFETPFDTVVSTTLAAGGGVIILTVLSFAGAALAGDGAMSPSMRFAVRSGLLTLIVALAAGAVMIATGVTEVRSGDAQLAYDTAGFLKPLHAVAMHGILVLPALAWLLGFTGYAEARQLRYVRLAAAGYAVLLVIVTIGSIAARG